MNITITKDIDKMNGRELAVGSVYFTVPFEFTNEQVIKVVRNYFESELKEQREFNKLVLERRNIIRLSGTTVAII